MRRADGSDAGYDRGLWARLGGELGVLGAGRARGARRRRRHGLVDQAVVAEECGAALLPARCWARSAWRPRARRRAAAHETLVRVRRGHPDGRAASSGDRRQAAGAADTDGRGRRRSSTASADVLVVAAARPTAHRPLPSKAATRAPIRCPRWTRRAPGPRRASTRRPPVCSPRAPTRSGRGAARRTAGGAARGGAGRGAQRLLDHDRRLRGHAAAVRPPDRLVPGREAPVRRHAGARSSTPGLPRTTPRGRWPTAPTTPISPWPSRRPSVRTPTGVALDAVQMHGGIGFTWEHPTHLYSSGRSPTPRCSGAPSGTASASRSSSWTARARGREGCRSPQADARRTNSHHSAPGVLMRCHFDLADFLTSSQRVDLNAGCLRWDLRQLMVARTCQHLSCDDR